MYHVLAILLHRPFVADGHLYNTSRAISVNSFMECASAASNIVHLLRVYDRSFSIRRAPYLISYATYVAATIHARIAAKQDVNSEAHSNLETCLAVFQENQETNWAVQRANGIVQGLMKRLGVVMRSASDGWIIDRDRRAVTSPSQLAETRRDDVPSNTDVSHTMTPMNNWSTSRHISTNGGIIDLDIDGIIQSFLGEQDSAQVPSAPTNVVDTEAFPVSNPQPLSYEIPPQSRPADQAGDGHGAIARSGWQQPSVDDLLFGFNGSALDSFQGIN